MLNDLSTVSNRSQTEREMYRLISISKALWWLYIVYTTYLILVCSHETSNAFTPSENVGYTQRGLHSAWWADIQFILSQGHVYLSKRHGFVGDQFGKMQKHKTLLDNVKWILRWRAILFKNPTNACHSIFFIPAHLFNVFQLRISRWRNYDSMKVFSCAITSTISFLHVWN